MKYVPRATSHKARTAKICRAAASALSKASLKFCPPSGKVPMRMKNGMQRRAGMAFPARAKRVF